MQLKLLQAKHPSYDAETWADYWALYKGGKTWRERAHRFIARNPQEPEDVYLQRVKAAHYRSYMGPIIDYFVSFLFTSQLIIRAQRDEQQVDPDPFYGLLKEDCDGRGTDLIDLLRNRLTRALVEGCSYWLLEMPDDGGAPPVDRAEWTQRGLGRARLRMLDRSSLLDWDCDEYGNLLWMLTYASRRPRWDPRAPRNATLHTWRLYDQQTVETFQLVQEDGEHLAPEQEVPSFGARPHGFGRVPLISLELPDGLWIADRIESPQREHCALSNAHTWLIRRTCYAMPVFKVKNREPPPVMGAGYYLMIGADESFEWAAPNTTAFDAIRQEVTAQKDEIHRIVHQMAQGVENNAAAVGRSAASKQADAVSTRVMLEALGACVREAVGRTYELLTSGRGEDYRWSIEGLQGYQTEDVAALLEAITQAITLDIPSPTFGEEIRARAALALLPDADQAVKDQIRQEVRANFIPESVLQPRVTLEEDEDASAS